MQTNSITDSKSNRTVVLGVTGCIAAYKACEIVRLFQKKGITVLVMMTENATRFIGPDTLSALSGSRVCVNEFDENGILIPHINLVRDADAVLIAPCTANMLAKIANGIADDLVSSAVLANTAPLFVAPAMNVHMYENPATQANLKTLASRGVSIIEADCGYLACGEEGKGRLPEPAEIVDAVYTEITTGKDLCGKRVLITAGPTREYIDPVRFVTNCSSGKMGYACAQAAASRGAIVTLVSGPTNLACPRGVQKIDVTSAQEMFDACMGLVDSFDIAICTAAVCDFRPEQMASSKLKKGVDGDALALLQMVENPDILHALCVSKTESQVVVGFAAETDNLIEAAKAKLASKGADMIVGNYVGAGVGFDSDDNAATIVTASGAEELTLMPKTKLAHAILDRIAVLS